MTQKYIYDHRSTTPSGNFFEVEDVLDTNKPLPGGLGWYKYTYNGVDYYRPQNAKKTLTIYYGYCYKYSENGVNLNGTYEVWIEFWKEGKNVYEPQPAVCAGLVSWAMSLASSRRVYLNFYDNNWDSSAYWDSKSGTAPPDQSLCKNTIALDIYLW